MTPNNIKRATPDHPIHELLIDRWSPYVYDPRPVERQKLLACLEAARWAASSYNEQTWSLIVAPREQMESFRVMLGCLVEANQLWAKHAGVLMLTVVHRHFTRNGQPNRVAEHDLGLAAANLSLQATALGLQVHQMAGVNLSLTRQTYKIPDTHDPMTAIALGYAADASEASDKGLGYRDRSPRIRKPLAEFVFANAWNQPASLAQVALLGRAKTNSQSEWGDVVGVVPG